MTPTADRSLRLAARPALAAVAALAILGIGLGLGHRALRARVRKAADPERARSLREKPLAFLPLAAGRADVAVLGDETITGAVTLDGGAGGLLLGGGSGLRLGSRRLDVASGLRSLRVSAVASWRGQGV